MGNSITEIYEELEPIVKNSQNSRSKELSNLTLQQLTTEENMVELNLKKYHVYLMKDAFRDITKITKLKNLKSGEEQVKVILVDFFSMTVLTVIRKMEDFEGRIVKLNTWIRILRTIFVQIRDDFCLSLLRRKELKKLSKYLTAYLFTTRKYKDKVLKIFGDSFKPEYSKKIMSFKKIYRDMVKEDLDIQHILALFWVSFAQKIKADADVFFYDNELEKLQDFGYIKERSLFNYPKLLLILVKYEDGFFILMASVHEIPPSIVIKSPRKDFFKVKKYKIEDNRTENFSFLSEKLNQSFNKVRAGYSSTTKNKHAGNSRSRRHKHNGSLGGIDYTSLLETSLKCASPGQSVLKADVTINSPIKAETAKKMRKRNYKSYRLNESQDSSSMVEPPIKIIKSTHNILEGADNMDFIRKQTI